MKGRIGALHVHYRARAGAMAAALVPGLDRALKAGLGDVIAERLAQILGDDEQVVVIRELTAAVRIGNHDLSLDRRVIERIGRASADAVATALGTPTDTDALVRFLDQASFVGSFIVDLMDGSAWDRWYYGAFRRYWDTDVAATIEAVLTGNTGHAARVYGWLARRGQLTRMLGVLRPATARRLAAAEVSPAEGGGPPADLRPLVAAGFDLLTSLGWTVPDSVARATLVSGYLAASNIPPSWTDSRSLSSWLLGFIEFVQKLLIQRGAVRESGDREGIQRLCAGRLDWLDAAWLEPRLIELTERRSPGNQPAPDPTRRILDLRDERILESLTAMVSAGRLPLERHAERDELIVQLLAMVGQEATEAGPPSRTLVAVIERIADAWHAHVSGAGGTDHVTAPLPSADTSPSASAMKADHGAAEAAVRAASPAALALLQQIVRAATQVPASGDPTNGAGLFLLTRALLDVRLALLARDAGVSFEALRATLALEWLGLRPPYDGPVSVWVGAEQPGFALLDAPAARLADLEQALLGVLVDQHTIDALPPDEELFDRGPSPGETAVSDTTSLACRRIAWMVMRSWSRWLPGVGGSGVSYLIRNCLKREGRVGVSDRAIAVELAPALLDPVLVMAGYFRPIEAVPWLAGRTVAFTVRTDASDW